ncbi:MAG: chromate efflux transporter [Gemmatimonadetes bacterium]|nr:chromate efflux transporter [Gemmatimonadota bacterium]
MEQPSSSPAARAVEGVPNESLGALFVRFLRFGLLAWGGPVAQIAMIREQLVDRERWISRERFHRVLAVYQALPGPEAHELCAYFGMLARGRSGAIVAGLGFMLPGFALMLLLSWSYVRFGVDSPLWRGAMLGCQGAVAALIVRAVVRLGQHALSTRRLGVIAVAAAASQFAGANGIVVLALLASRTPAPARGRRPRLWLPAPLVANAVVVAPSIMTLFGSGLRAGLLTFGGAYTAIPFLRSDAVITGRWMTDAQFLDGLALSSVLPAPFIIFSTFVGTGGGMVGAVVVTAGVFLPAFAFTLVGHDQLERIVETPSTHDFLDGVTAGVVGIIAVTAWSVGGDAHSPLAVVTFVGALAASPVGPTVAWVMGGAALIGVAARAT